MASQIESEAQAEVQTNVRKLQPLLKRLDGDPRPVVVMMCGVAGSGKSTYAKAIARFFPNFKRISIDNILAERHGICGIDYPESEYERHSTEADEIFRDTAAKLLEEGRSDLVLDRALYAKEDRDFFRNVAEKNGARHVLLYLQAPKGVLWTRIRARRQAGLDADCALEISEELLDAYVDGFEVPDGEGEIVLGSNEREVAPN